MEKLLEKSPGALGQISERDLGDSKQLSPIELSASATNTLWNVSDNRLTLVFNFQVSC